MTFWAEPGWTGNQWARMIVPSNEVTFQSLGTPGTGVATTGRVGRGRWQVVLRRCRHAAPDPSAGVDDVEHPVRTTAMRAEPAARTEPGCTTIALVPFFPFSTMECPNPLHHESIPASTPASPRALTGRPRAGGDGCVHRRWDFYPGDPGPLARTLWQ